jgi:hypothetical protein
LLLSCQSSFYVQDYCAPKYIWFPNTSSHPVGCFFTFLIMSFNTEKFLILMKLRLSVLVFLLLTLLSNLSLHSQSKGHKTCDCFLPRDWWL